MAFDRFLLLLPSSAGGYLETLDEATDTAARLGLCGWILGCRSDGVCASTGRRITPRMEVAVLSTFGEPNEQVLATALEAAGRRHTVDYRLIP